MTLFSRLTTRNLGKSAQVSVCRPGWERHVDSHLPKHTILKTEMWHVVCLNHGMVCFPIVFFSFPIQIKVFTCLMSSLTKRLNFCLQQISAMHCFFFNISSFNASIFNITITFLTFSSYFSLLILLLFFSTGHMKYSVRLHSTSYLLFFYKIIFFPLAGGAFKTFAFI